MLEITCNDRLGKKVRVKCNGDDTIGDLKKLIAAQTGTRADKIVLKKWYTIFKDHIKLEDFQEKACGWFRGDSLSDWDIDCIKLGNCCCRKKAKAATTERRGYFFSTGAGDQSSKQKYKDDNMSSLIHSVEDKDDFDNQLKEAGSKLVVVDFYATWCGPCKMIAPKLEEMAAQFTDVVFLKVDVDEVEEVASQYNISCMPTFMFIKNSEKVAEFSGANAEKLRDLVVSNK